MARTIAAAVVGLLVLSIFIAGDCKRISKDRSVEAFVLTAPSVHDLEDGMSVPANWHEMCLAYQREQHNKKQPCKNVNQWVKDTYETPEGETRTGDGATRH